MAGDIRSESFQTRYAVDGGEVQVTQWNESNQNEATFVPGRETEAFLDTLRQGERLVVRVTDFSGENHTAEFELAGMEEALAQLPCTRS